MNQWIILKGQLFCKNKMIEDNQRNFKFHGRSYSLNNQIEKHRTILSRENTERSFRKNYNKYDTSSRRYLTTDPLNSTYDADHSHVFGLDAKIL